MKRFSKVRILVELLLVTAGILRAAENLARGRPYSWNRPPNYRHCKDPADKTQLTDGGLSRGYFWVQKETVGWVHVNPVIITIDLGKSYPLCGLSVRTAFGTAGVFPPKSIFVFASCEGKPARYLGDLIALDARRRAPPPPSPYRVYTYHTMELKGEGRYVTLAVVPRGAYFFCDEIEIYRGTEGGEYGRPVNDISRFISKARTLSGLKERLRHDLATVRKRAEKLLEGSERRRILSAVRRLSKRIEDLEDLPDGFRSIVPATDLHREILALNASLLRARGFSGLLIWRRHRYAPIAPTSEPAARASEALGSPISIALMRGEYRARVFNLTNAADKPVEVKFWFEGLPGSPKPSYVRPFEVVFVDTVSGEPVADALPEAGSVKEGWIVEVPAGMNRQVWLRFCVKEVPPGVYSGSLRLSWRTGSGRIPFELKVSPLKFPSKMNLSLGLWDYTDDPPAYDITPSNREAAVRNMQEHFVDAPWAHRSVLPWPAESDFDKEGRLTASLDFSNLRRWVSRWPDARWYCIFLAVGNGRFAGVGCTEEPFTARVASWARAVASEVRRLGKDPGQFALLILDEPHSREQDRIILHWARALKKGCPEFVIWEDPTYRNPHKEALKEAYEACDILCPNLGIFLSGTEEARRFYLDLVNDGKRSLWFYQCTGPARLLDPQAYHRLQAWYCFRWGAVGSGFWAYGDAGGSAWNVYAAGRTIYSPVYLEKESVTDGKHFEAVREGLEDYQYLVMVKDFADKTADVELAQRARRLIREALREVIPRYRPEEMWWRGAKDYEAADRARLKLLSFLEEVRRR